eukprot:1259291-Amphidinium_carterae.1
MSRKMLQDQGHLPELPLRRWLTEMMESRSDAQGDWRDGHALQIWHSPSRPITRPTSCGSAITADIFNQPGTNRGQGRSSGRRDTASCCEPTASASGSSPDGKSATTRSSSTRS